MRYFSSLFFQYVEECLKDSGGTPQIRIALGVQTLTH